MTKENTYHRTLVDAIQTIDDVQYMKFHPKWARLRKIIDLVLNKDWDYDDDTIEYAEECVRITQEYYKKRREEKANAKFTDTVDFPTPPLPLATAIYFLMLGNLGFSPSDDDFSVGDSCLCSYTEKFNSGKGKPSLENALLISFVSS